MEFSAQFFDLEKKQNESTRFFFLENVLKARMALNLPTGRHEDNDEDTNVYVAGLLSATLSRGEALTSKPYISPYDVDVRNYLDAHPGASHQFVVYKDNADFSLVNISIFLDHEHKGSYHRRVLENTDETGRVALYYSMAANALEQIGGHQKMLVHTFHSLSEHLEEIVRIMRKVATDYLNFVQPISDGSFFHLEREVDALVKYAEFQRTLDEFLKRYSIYKKNPSSTLRSLLLEMVKRLKSLNPEFKCDEERLLADEEEAALDAGTESSTS